MVVYYYFIFGAWFYRLLSTHLRLSPNKYQIFIHKHYPSSKNIKEYLPQGDELSYPLDLPKGFNLGVFADLKGDLPRALAFDEKGVLFASIPGSGKIIALPDENGDGKADRIVEVMRGLARPHGIAFAGDFIYVGETDKVVRARYDPENLSVGSVEKLFDLPGGGRHFTRTIRIKDGKIYTSVGSSCDTCLEDSPYRAAVLVSDLDGTDKSFCQGSKKYGLFYVRR